MDQPEHLTELYINLFFKNSLVNVVLRVESWFFRISAVKFKVCGKLTFRTKNDIDFSVKRITSNFWIIQWWKHSAKKSKLSIFFTDFTNIEMKMTCKGIKKSAQPPSCFVLCVFCGHSSLFLVIEMSEVNFIIL